MSGRSEAVMDGVAGWFAKRGEMPLSPPAALRGYGPLSDDPDRPDSEFTSDLIRGVAFGMEYCDSRGWASTRAVRCLALDPRPPLSIKAFCTVRATTRTFRVDRIISIVNFRTGAILSADHHVALLAPYLRDYDHDHRTGQLRSLQRATRDGVFALLQFAMPDGRLSDRSRDIVLSYVQAEAQATGCSLPSPDLVELWIDNLAPPLDAVTAAADRLLAEKAKFARLLPWLFKVVRGREAFVDQEESIRELIDEVRSHFRRKLLEWPVQVGVRQLPHAG
jgi:hypothetical protein